MKKIYLIFCSLLFSVAFAQIKIHTDLILQNAKIYTVNANFDVAESMAILNGKVVAIGTNSEVFLKYTAPKIKDMQGQVIVPGFNDAHCHFVEFALDKWKCELWGTQSWEEILQRLKEYEKTTTQKWIYGRSWDQNDWQVKEFPNKEKLDQLFPNRPVFLKRIDGHAAIANKVALELAGITPETKVEGGEAEVVNGKLTGVLLDNAMNLVEKQIPEISENLALNYLESVQNDCFAYGLTSVQDCGISEKMYSLLDKSQKKKILKMKVFALLEDNPATYEKWIPKGRFTSGLITFGGYKVYADGALGSRGACLLKDYSDKAQWKGLLLNQKLHFEEMAQKLIKTNLQMVTHAIGDSANRVILNVYGDVLKEKNDRRWRIEHAQVVNQNDFNLFGKFSVIPSVQPTHATSDMYWAESRLGKERLKHAYAYKELLQQNGWLPLGTDFPVEEINPFKTFYAAVVRKDDKNFPEAGFQKENALTREEALRGMTIWAAKASFDDTKTGSLEEGKAADFVILNQDLMTVPENKILETRAVETYINGEKVH